MRGPRFPACSPTLECAQNGRSCATNGYGRRDWWADRDAPVVANLLTLLIAVDPDRRGINVSSDPQVEQARWNRILERHQEITTQLITMRAGHPSELIRACAGELEVQMAQAVTQTQWLVKDLLENRDVGDQDIAEQSHRAASETASKLERLVIEYGSSGKVSG